MFSFLLCILGLLAVLSCFFMKIFFQCLDEPSTSSDCQKNWPLWLILAHLHDEHCLFMRKITKRKTKQPEGSEKTGSYVKNDRKPLNASVLSFTQLSKAGWLSAVWWLVLVSNAKLLHFQKEEYTSAKICCNWSFFKLLIHILKICQYWFFSFCSF